jgi:hypothetical protein
MRILLIGAVMALGLTLAGCEDHRGAPEQQGPGTGGAGPHQDGTYEQGADLRPGWDDAEEVNPHTMGGTGQEGIADEPPADLTVGAGSDSDLEEPRLQDGPQQPGEQR